MKVYPFVSISVFSFTGISGRICTYNCADAEIKMLKNSTVRQNSLSKFFLITVRLALIKNNQIIFCKGQLIFLGSVTLTRVSIIYFTHYLKEKSGDSAIEKINNFTT